MSRSGYKTALGSPADSALKRPHPITDAEMASGEFLKSLEPREELAVFLLQRSCCFQAHDRMEDARACLAEGLQLMPNSPTLRGALMSTFGRGPQRRMAQRSSLDPAHPPPGAEASMPPSPMADAWRPGPVAPDPGDPTPRIALPGVNPTFGIPNNRPITEINQEVPR